MQTLGLNDESDADFEDSGYENELSIEVSVSSSSKEGHKRTASDDMVFSCESWSIVSWQSKICLKSTFWIPPD